MKSDYEVVSGGVYPELATDIARQLGKKIVAVELKRFSNGERYARFDASVRKKDLFIVQSFAEVNGYTLNDALMELLLLVDAARRASAREITVVLPIMPYSRQDRKARNREPISVAVVIRMLAAMRVDRIVSMDLHSAQTQAIFDLAFDHIIAEPLITETLKNITKKAAGQYVVVSPDAGRAKESEYYAHALGTDLAHLPKARDKNTPSKISRPENISGVDGKKCLIIDDIIDTGGTLLTAAETLKKSGAKEVIAVATHGVLSGEALARFSKPTIDKLYLVNTLPQTEHKKVLGNKLVEIDISPLLAESIRRIADGESLAFLFDDKNNR